MKSLFCEGTNTTFEVTMNKDASLFQIKGKSRPENVVEFFEPIFSWIDTYFENPNENTVLNFYLDYFNSSTAKVLIRFFVKLESYYKKGNNILINWYYNENDEDMLETGEDFESLVVLPFKIMPNN